MQWKKLESFTFTLQQKAQRVTRYIQMQYFTSIRPGFQAKYWQTTANDSTRRWVENYNSILKVENRSKSARPATTNEKVKAARKCFRAHPRIFMRRAESDLGIPWSTITTILKKWLTSCRPKWFDLMNYYLSAVLIENRSLRSASTSYRKIKTFPPHWLFYTNLSFTNTE